MRVQGISSKPPRFEPPGNSFTGQDLTFVGLGKGVMDLTPGIWWGLVQGSVLDAWSPHDFCGTKVFEYVGGDTGHNGTSERG